MSKKFVVNPLSITYEQIRNELRLLIANNQNTFTDFFNDGSGSSVVDLAASLGALFAFHVISQRKEFTLEQAVSYKSLIGNAYDKGYSISRGKNLKVNLIVTPETTGTLTEWTTIGSCDEFDVVLMKNVSFTTGVPCTLEVVVGDRLSETKYISTENTTIFRFTSDDVTDDVRLLLNDSEIVYSNNVADLLNDKYLMMSNSYGSVNVFYLQTGNYKYKVGDTLAIDYIARNSIDFSAVSASSFYIQGFEVIDISENTARVTKEKKDDIRVGAALHAETAGVIKARGDFKKVLRESDETIESINDYNIQPGRVGIIVAKKDHTTLSEADKIRYNTTVASKSATGVANVIYTNAHTYSTPLKVTITGTEGIATSTSLVPSTQSYIADYEYKLGKYIDFNDVEDYIEKELDGVKVARITIDTPAWSSKNYRVSDSVIATSFNNKAYYVDKIAYRTGAEAPNWDSLTDGYVVDNQVLWKEYFGEPEGIMVWKPNVTVALGKLVVTALDSTARVFECHGYVARTGTVEPDWESGETTLFDNQIVWVKSEPETATLSSWTSNTLLPIGEVINKVKNKAVEETFVNQVQYAYYSARYGGTFYTEVPIVEQAWVYSDENLSKTIGYIDSLDSESKLAAIALQGTYDDTSLFVYKFLIGGNLFYTAEPIKAEIKCYYDAELTDAIGTITNINTDNKTLTIQPEDKSKPVESNGYDDTSIFVYKSDMRSLEIFYTKIKMGEGTECYADSKFLDYRGTTKSVVTTTKRLEVKGDTASKYQDFTTFKYEGNATGTFYTESELETGLACYADSGLKNEIGKAELTGNNKIKITKEGDITGAYYKVSDYAMKSSDSEPDWSNKTLDGYVEDGQLFWKETEYPVRAIKLADDTYAKFDSNIVMAG